MGLADRLETEAALRARAVESQMSDAERFSLLVSVMGTNSVSPTKDPRIPDGVPMSAGYVPGVERLGVPALLMSDASLGVTNPGYREGDTATALPAGLALASSFNPDLARAAGHLLGREARSRGFNVQLAGGANLVRDPRNGRNFEYLSEDPLHTAVLAAASIEGIQAEGVISTIKHLSLNCNETNRHWLDAVIDPAAHRESDLLAFELAIAWSRPGAVMTGYNKVNGEYAGGSRVLLEEILKGRWGYDGWVMSDWGATPSWTLALAGLDQESGAQVDRILWHDEPFTEPLREAHARGDLPAERLSEMVRRILTSMFEIGIDQWGPAPSVDLEAHHEIALETARQGIVLLANDGVLPLDPDAAVHIAVIGGHAQVGVLTGCGSSAVVPPGGFAEVVRIGGAHAQMSAGRNLYLLPSSPLAELQRLMPHAQFEWDPGMSPAEAAMTARRCDLVIAFGVRVEGEGFDNADLTLPWGQDAVIEAVAEANPNTVVVLETGNPVEMPWLDKVRAVLQAWYPGQGGGRAIAEVLTGAVVPSGRLPMTFPRSLADHPRPVLPGLDTAWGTPTTIRYDEGAEVGYRWCAATGAEPLFGFGHGLSYTTFVYEDLRVEAGPTVAATVRVRNVGERSGADVPQLYLTAVNGQVRQRLLAFSRVELAPGESAEVSLVAERRVLARYDGADGFSGRWRIEAGRYDVAVGHSATDLSLATSVDLDGDEFGG
ncbi:glycoside hydrolase family 3 protein [Nocardioides sp.]|uniref:beta-glucosidase n=1 Tax=Nocardioides sp. TaxID=35761 RepID=UPI00261C5149|nr:glycoside hydrolase family 3 protein [Nocardioides sp.]